MRADRDFRRQPYALAPWWDRATENDAGTEGSREGGADELNAKEARTEEKIEAGAEREEQRATYFVRGEEEHFERAVEEAVAGRTGESAPQAPSFVSSLSTTLCKIRAWRLTVLCLSFFAQGAPAHVSVYGRKVLVPYSITADSSRPSVCSFTFEQLCDAVRAHLSIQLSPSPPFLVADLSTRFEFTFFLIFFSLYLSHTQPLGPADYLTLASSYHTFILHRVPQLTLLQKNQARRLITFLDAVYEAGWSVRFLCSLFFILQDRALVVGSRR